MTVAEQAMIASVSGTTSKLSERLDDSIGKFLGAMSAADYDVATDGSVPDQLRNHIMADAVWEFLKDQPGLKLFKTDARKEAAETAEKVYEKIVSKEYGAIEPPSTIQKPANWGSENKLIMRTHPTPPPATQYGNTGNDQPEYANPNSLIDTPQVKVPNAPVNLIATSTVTGKVSLNWSPPMSALSFNIYRGTTSGGETIMVSGVTGASSYTDLTAASGTTYYYYVTAVNEVGEGAKSNEATVTAT